MIAIVDGGSTKCDWVILENTGKVSQKTESIGFNPNIISADLIPQEIEKNPHLFLIKNQLDYVYFYGSGCGTAENALLVETQLQKVFPYAKVTVKEDLTAAAYAAYKGKPAILKATMTEIRICDEYNRLICRHPRSYRDFPLYITDDNHMPPEHLYYKEVNAHDGAYYRRWASVYGESMVTLIDRILRSSKHEEQAYNSCAGVLHSCKDVPHRLVQEAAEKCVEANACKYSYFKKVLSMVQNNHSSSAINGTGKLPSHTNIRGKEAYK